VVAWRPRPCWLGPLFWPYLLTTYSLTFTGLYAYDYFWPYAYAILLRQLGLTAYACPHGYRPYADRSEYYVR